MPTLLALLLAAANPPSTEEALVAHVETANFVESKVPNSPKGAQNAVVGVDPNTKGSTAYSKTPAGAGIPAHWHSAPEYTVLLAGKATLTLDGKEHQLSAGSYVVIPAKTVHQLACHPGADCLLLVRRGGPTDYNFVKP